MRAPLSLLLLACLVACSSTVAETTATSEPDVSLTETDGAPREEGVQDAAVNNADVQSADTSIDTSSVDAEDVADSRMMPDVIEVDDGVADSDRDPDTSTTDAPPDTRADCGPSQTWTRAVNFHEGDPLPADVDEYEVSFRGRDGLYPVFSMIYVVMYEEYMGAWHLHSLSDTDRDLHMFTDEQPWLACEYAAGRTATFRYHFRVRQGDVAGIVFAFNTHEAGSTSPLGAPYTICNPDRSTWPVEIRRVGSAGLLHTTNFNEPRHYPGTPCYGLIEGSPCPPGATRQSDGSCHL